MFTGSMEQQTLRVEEYFSRLLPFKIPLILIAISISFIVTAGIMFFQRYQTQHEGVILTTGDLEASMSGRRVITVDIGGGVHIPGVYELPEGSRIEDAIQAAGGFHERADSELIQRSVNRAQRLMDGSKLYIPISIDIDGMEDLSGEAVLPNNDTSHNIKSPEQSSISINVASQTELETLSGVGPATAKKIIDARPYMNIDELVAKKAVGQKLFDRIKDYISL